VPEVSRISSPSRTPGRVAPVACPGYFGTECSTRVPLERRRGTGALATNWASKFHRALGYLDTAVCFRNRLRSGSSGATQVGLPTSCQSTRSFGGLLGTLRAGQLHGWRDRPASMRSLSLALRFRGSSADLGEGRGPCSARRSQTGSDRGAGPAPLRAGGSATAWMPQGMPDPWTPVLGCLGSVGSRAGAGRAGAAPAGACAPPIPASRHRGPDGLQGSTSNVATSSQEHACRAPSRSAIQDGGMTEPIEPNTAAPRTSTWPNIKVARAAQHFSGLQSRVGLWMATSPFGAEGAISDDRLKWTLRLRVDSPPPVDEWGTYMGDCIHNLRSALDAAVWDFATSEGKSPAIQTQIGFPIATKASEWKDTATRKLDGVPAEVIERIRLLQPFQRPTAERTGDLLALLQRLDNDDKHRSRIVALLEWQKMEHEFSVEFASDGAAARNAPPDTTINVPDFDDGALLVEHRTVDPIVKVKGGFNFGARLAIETPLGPQPLLETLGSLINYVHLVLAVIYGQAVPSDEGAPDVTEA
jgi:hypothetical protein